jgi:hypothetical protein
MFIILQLFSGPLLSGNNPVLTGKKSTRALVSKCQWRPRTVNQNAEYSIEVQREKKLGKCIQHDLNSK